MEKKKPTSLAEAIVAFQHICPTIDKSAQGYGYKYAPLPLVMETILPLLTDLGIHVIQGTRYDESGRLEMHTTVCFGQESIDSRVPMVVNGKADMQDIGKSVSYARRYGICCALGIVTDEDPDDGKLAIDARQHKTLCNLLASDHSRDYAVQKIYEKCEVNALENVPKGKFEAITGWLVSRQVTAPKAPAPTPEPAPVKEAPYVHPVKPSVRDEVPF